MTSQTFKSSLGIMLGLGLVGILLAAASTPSQVEARPAALPPRPTATHTPTVPPGPTPPLPTPKPATTGALIELQLYLDSAWPWQIAHWQQLWTVVQWQDGLGDWHDVEGWQGGLETLTVGDDGFWGQRLWWVAPGDLGKGPFRWVIYAAPDKAGEMLVASKPFYLPSSSGQIKRVCFK